MSEHAITALGEEPHDWKPTTNTLAVWRCTKCGGVGFSPHRLPKIGCDPDPAPSWHRAKVIKAETGNSASYLIRLSNGQFFSGGRSYWPDELTNVKIIVDAEGQVRG